MATFHAPKGFYFGASQWAKFELIPGSDPAVYAFETDDPAVIARLAGVEDVTRVDGDQADDVEAEPKPKARKAAQPSKRRKAAEQSHDDSSAAEAGGDADGQAAEATQTSLEDVEGDSGANADS
ncbi:head-tail connector protein [Mycobacterium phage Mendokysei]|uniref:Uncharacterized protein n=1 Tax=Mycobacterium phage Mendokysei TaxID=2099637 RepID=A0A2P1CG78_9CAUD|nr:head-tail connector protein [Mycobacterium phage Mendokysei]AVJ50226.1 hypothetical protein SEA_MENDOKYSEI_8 [Mycobacterium phage Mendokysei]